MWEVLGTSGKLHLKVFCGYFLWGEVYSGDYVNMNISITKCSNSMELVSFISNMDGIVNTNSGAFEIFE